MHTCAIKYPYASFYILGVFDGAMSYLNPISKSKAGLQALQELDQAIRKYHPEWNKDEIYLRGFDLGDAIDDLIIKPKIVSEYEKFRLMKKVLRRTGHHYSLIKYTHMIGKMFKP